MGTHPIFESDFDCLTACWESLLAEVSLLLSKSAWTQSKLSLSTRSENTPLNPVLVQLELMLLSNKNVLIFKSVGAVPTVVVIWNLSQPSTSLSQIFTKMPSTVKEPLTSKLAHNLFAIANRLILVQMFIPLDSDES